jgi:hypothetical protein
MIKVNILVRCEQYEGHYYPPAGEAESSSYYILVRGRYCSASARWAGGGSESPSYREGDYK